MADFKRGYNGTVYRVRRAEYQHNLAVIEIFGGTFEFGSKIQRAILPRYSTKQIPVAEMYYVASFGSVNNEYPHLFAYELHGQPIYVGYANIPDNLRNERFCMYGPNQKKLLFNQGDLGGPVWDLDTGEVVALIFDVRQEQDCTYALTIGWRRFWIEDVRHRLHLD